MMNYDVAIVGSGPGGIFCALELVKNPRLKILLLEKGVDLPSRDPDSPEHRLYGFGGAGAFSDGKLTLSGSIGGELEDLLGIPLDPYLEEVDGIFREHGAPAESYPVGERVQDLQRKAISCGLTFLPFVVRHIGTDRVPKVMASIRERLLAHRNLTYHPQEPVYRIEKEPEGFLLKLGGCQIRSKRVVVAVGRGGGGWLNEGLPPSLNKSPGPVDLGVRLEVPRFVFDHITQVAYDPKFIYYSSFDDRVRTFCVNPGGYVSLEMNHYYGGSFFTVNGHSNRETKSEMTNMALLVSTRFTQPFNDPFAYGQKVAQLANLLGGRCLIQRVSDFKRGRRSTPERIQRSIYKPTLPEATPGDISFALPYRQTRDIDEMLNALETLCPGVISEGSYLYFPEVKFYGSRFSLSPRMESNLPGLYLVGDCSGWTRGLMQSSISGLVAARGIS